MTKEARSTENNKVEMEFSEDEEMLIARMFNLVGERWSLIAGRIPGRTAEEIQKYWTSTHSSQSQSKSQSHSQPRSQSQSSSQHVEFSS